MIRLSQYKGPVWVNTQWVKYVEPCRDFHLGPSKPGCRGSKVHLYTETWPLHVDETPEVVVGMIEAAHGGS